MGPKLNRHITPLNIVEEDDCCADPLWKVIASGKLDGKDTWTHGKCGCEWRAREMTGGGKFWYPVVQVWII